MLTAVRTGGESAKMLAPLISFSIVWSICFLGVLQMTCAFSPGNSLADCPKLQPQNNIKLSKLTGTWRLGFLYIDDAGEELEEEKTCGVVEIMQLNETKMELLLYVDSRKDEFTIDRYTKAFDVTVLSPGEWLIHTSFKYLEEVYVTAIAVFGDHLILSFCAYPFSHANIESEHSNEFNSPSNNFENDVNDIFKAQTYGNILKTLEGNENENVEPSSQHTEPFYGGRRRVRENTRASVPEELTYRKLFKKKGGQLKKHLWTAILVRSNKVSALEFVENASFLMKLGYQISKGQLVGFGSCSLSK